MRLSLSPTQLTAPFSVLDSWHLMTNLDRLEPCPQVPQEHQDLASKKGALQICEIHSQRNNIKLVHLGSILLPCWPFSLFLCAFCSLSCSRHREHRELLKATVVSPIRDTVRVFTQLSSTHARWASSQVPGWFGLGTAGS